MRDHCWCASTRGREPSRSSGPKRRGIAQHCASVGEAGIPFTGSVSTFAFISFLHLSLLVGIFIVTGYSAGSRIESVRRVSMGCVAVCSTEGKGREGEETYL